jgi:hypothetical protein
MAKKGVKAYVRLLYEYDYSTGTITPKNKKCPSAAGSWPTT